MGVSGPLASTSRGQRNISLVSVERFAIPPAAAIYHHVIDVNYSCRPARVVDVDQPNLE